MAEQVLKVREVYQNRSTSDISPDTRYAVTGVEAGGVMTCPIDLCRPPRSMVVLTVQDADRKLETLAHEALTILGHLMSRRQDDHV